MVSYVIRKINESFANDNVQSFQERAVYPKVPGKRSGIRRSVERESVRAGNTPRRPDAPRSPYAPAAILNQVWAMSAAPEAVG